MIPSRFAPLVMTALMSLFMALFMTVVITLLLKGTPNFWANWIKSFTMCYPIAFVAALIVMPIVKKLTFWLTQQET